MGLAPGTRLGPYDVHDLVGVGGMGEVYRARDTKLQREVAIKTLPAVFAGDPDRLARFEREARTLAALNHPNIAHIHGVIEQPPALVMEFVDGEDLAQRIARGAVPLEDAVPIARQIVDALEAAHEQGIVHRDLKPANVKVRPDGTVKVLDFGLARAMTEDAHPASPALSPTSPVLTATSPAVLTRMGVLLGSAAYMAPEQARGKPVDKRADIWAFGCLFYEMLAGRRPFSGDSVADVLAAVVKDPPDWTALPDGTPGGLRRLLQRCLEKDPRRRLRDIGDTRFELDVTDAGVATVPVESRPTRVLWPLVLGLAAGGLLTALGTYLAVRDRTPAPLVRIATELGPAAVGGEVPPSFALSPDGQTIVFVARESEPAARRLFVRQLAELDARPLAGTEGAAMPFFSPDGRAVGFFAEAKLKKVSLGGGTPSVVCSANINSRGGSWSDDGTIVFSPTPNSGLMRVSAEGGTPESLTALEGEDYTHRFPEFLPGGGILYVRHTRSSDFRKASIEARPAGGGMRKTVVSDATFGRFMHGGYLLYVRDNAAYAAPFDPARLEITGPSVPVFDNVRMALVNGGAELAVSNAGTAIYQPARASQVTLAWLGRDGSLQPARIPPGRYFEPALSPDGRYAALSVSDGQRPLALWFYDFVRESLTRVTLRDDTDQTPVWTPDGLRIAYASWRADTGIRNVYWQRVDGTGEAERLTSTRAGDGEFPTSWHPGGHSMLLQERTAQDGYDLKVLAIAGSEADGWQAGDVRAFLSSPANERDARFSPDGRFVAYGSDESGRAEIYVRPFPGPGGRWQVSTGGGSAPQWSRRSNEVLYVGPDRRIMSARWRESNGTFTVDKPTEGTSLPPGTSNPVLHPDGQRFLVLNGSGPADTSSPVVLVFNLPDEIRRAISRRKP
jgi:serine/threonine-protein kinase